MAGPAGGRWREGERGTGSGRAPIAAAVVAAIRVYQKTISAWTPRTCRYHPTCSEYAIQAVTRYGAARGLWMAVRRIARCHPFAPGGQDPVP